MLGAIVGDIVGSVFERAPHKSKEFDFISEKKPLHGRFRPDARDGGRDTARLRLHGGIQILGALQPERRIWRQILQMVPLRREGTGRKLRQRLRDARLPRRVGLRHARRSSRRGEEKRRAEPQPPRGHKGRVGRRRGDIPRAHGKVQGRDKRIRRKGIRLRPEPHRRQDKTRL